MTTTVTIEAHLANSKEVEVKVFDGPKTIEEFTLQDGERAFRYVYDNRSVSVREIEKEVVFQEN